MEKSLPNKLRGWREPGVRFVIVRDNDGGDCLALKDHLRRLCSDRSEEDWLVRSACQELEAWYLGEPDALAEAFDKESLRWIGLCRSFRSPDAVLHPAKALTKLIPEFQKVSGARRLAQYLTRERNSSPSFHALLDGVEQLTFPPPPATSH